MLTMRIDSMTTASTKAAQTSVAGSLKRWMPGVADLASRSN